MTFTLGPKKPTADKKYLSAKNAQIFAFKLLILFDLTGF